LRNNKLIVIISIFFCIVFSFASCKTNDPLSFEGNPPSSQKSDPPKSKSKDSQEKSNPTPAPKAADPPPKASPKNKAAEKKPVKKQVNQDIIVASFSTKIIDYDENRIHNIMLAAKQIDGHILAPGETFSFNGVVGKRDHAKGYKEATVLVKGERDADIGGGVCQLSSTIYNAAVRSGLQIIERHTHSGEVHYVPRGRDAAVSYGYMDLQFKNTKSYPIKFRISVEDGRVSVSILKATH
jgi:vancomycin resistance protein YoaR